MLKVGGGGEVGRLEREGSRSVGWGGGGEVVTLGRRGEVGSLGGWGGEDEVVEQCSIVNITKANAKCFFSVTWFFPIYTAAAGGSSCG